MHAGNERPGLIKDYVEIVRSQSNGQTSLPHYLVFSTEYCTSSPVITEANTTSGLQEKLAAVRFHPIVRRPEVFGTHSHNHYPLTVTSAAKLGIRHRFETSYGPPLLLIG